MSHFFIRRPIFAIVLSLVIVLIGTLAMISLPVAQFPPISPPLIQVQATYIGASATVLEQSVATAIENQVVGVSNMIYMQSTSTSVPGAPTTLPTSYCRKPINPVTGASIIV